MGRRANGEGCIRKRPDGRWEGRIVIGRRANGKGIVHSVYGTTQKEMLDKFNHAREMYRDVHLCEVSLMPLALWLEFWLEKQMKDSIRDSTYKSYCHMSKNYVAPFLGKKPLYKVTSIDLQTLYAKLRESGRVNFHHEHGKKLSGSTVFSVHCMLHLAFDAAVKARFIPNNPADGVVVPQKDRPTMQVLNEAQLERFMDAIREDKIWYDLFYTEITTGLRRGEICGLMWSDLDEQKGILTVQRTIDIKGRDHQVIIHEPKTDTGKRQIKLAPSTLELLKQRHLTSRSEWVFPNLFDLEKPVSPSSAYHRLKEILEEVGLPSIRFHDLRHTFATHALTNGVDAKTLSGILGHTNASFTLDTYTHVTTEMQRAAALIVDHFLIDLLGAEFLNGET